MGLMKFIMQYYWILSSVFLGLGLVFASYVIGKSYKAAEKISLRNLSFPSVLAAVFLALGATFALITVL